VGPGVGEVDGDPRRIDDDVAQLPPVVREAADDRPQVLGVGVEPAVRAVDQDVGCDELAQVVDAWELQQAL